jgi:hypothetical protein
VLATSNRSSNIVEAYITREIGTVDIHPKYMRRVHRADGYTYDSQSVD